MKLNDLLNKVIYIKEQEIYYYLTIKHDKDVFYGYWFKNKKLPSEISHKSEIKSWEKYLFNKDDENIEFKKKEDYQKECSIINKSLIKALFTGDLI